MKVIKKAWSWVKALPRPVFWLVTAIAALAVSVAVQAKSLVAATVLAWSGLALFFVGMISVIKGFEDGWKEAKKEPASDFQAQD